MTHKSLLSETVGSLRSLAKNQKQISVEDILHALGHRSYGPFFAVPALIELSPIGSIPGVPTVLAFIILLFGVQIVWGHSEMWLPPFLLRQHVSSRKMQMALKVITPIGKWGDRLSHQRLKLFTEGTMVRVAAGLCVLFALPVPLLEFIPFASSLSMIVILLFGISLLLKDGLIMLATFILAGVAILLMLKLSEIF